MAEVQLALQRGPAGFEKLVVVKLVHANLATQKDFVEMLLDEARVAALVKHPNVVDIYDLGQADGRYFIAMEYLEGEPLLAVLRAGREGKRLDVLSTARLVSDTAEGLDAAHELRSMAGEPLELVHHDVSLGNIVVLYNGQVKLVDFGVAKATQSVASRARVQGKFSYMAPEKLRGDAGDRRSDIWSLGCVLWEALTLKRLFKGGNDGDTMKQVLEAQIPLPSRTTREVLPDFDPIVMKALARDVDRRYATAKEMASDLEEVLRKQGYGGKNDAIAKYMQLTFSEHITARKKLLQEVSSKGRASADVLEAAFAEPEVASGSPRLSGDFSVRFRSPSQELQAQGPSSERRSGTTSPPRSKPLSIPPPLDLDVNTTVVQGVRVPDSRRRGWYAGGAVGVVLLVVVIVLATRSSGKEQPAMPPVAADASMLAATDAGIEPMPIAMADAAEAVGDAGDEITMEPDELGSGSGSQRVIKRPAANAAALAKEGIQAFVRGDTKVALQSFNRAKAANPSYAPTWRGLGMVHEKLGNRGAAKAAFQRYLILAPSAGDAAQIRARLANL